MLNWDDPLSMKPATEPARVPEAAAENETAEIETESCCANAPYF